MKVITAAVVPYRLAFRRPIVTSTTVATHREGALLRLESSSGRVGYGDAASWPGYGTDAAAVRRTLELVTKEGGPLLGETFRSVEDVRAWLGARPLPPETAYGVELALLSLLADRQNQSIAEMLAPDRPRAVVELHALVADAVSAKEAVRGGARAVKLKIGARPLAEDVTRVGAVRVAIGPDVGLRLDANGAWDPEAAIRAAKHFAGFAPQWIEQPVAAGDVDGLATVRREGGVPVAVDEGGQRLDDLERLIAAKAVDVLVVKPMFAGGILAGQKLARRAAAAGLGVTITHALESAVGRTGAMQLAGCLSDVAVLACGFGDPLQEDVAKAAVATGGWVDLPSTPGLGVNPSAWVRAAMAAGDAQGRAVRR